jgi:guanine nucleotide-binding protein G(i) subunit alpha
MGCCNGEEHIEEGIKRSQAIDRSLEEERKRLRQECKILVLGASNSGKSTIVKQMKIIHQSGFSEYELSTYRPTIYRNLLESATTLIQAMRHLEIEVESSENKEYCDYLMGYILSLVPAHEIDARVGTAVASLWIDPCMPKVFEHEAEFYLMDSAPYFFDEALRIAQPGYIPTEMDVLRSRTMTTGILETRFSMGQLRIHMFDVGGQRSERKKWIHCFENVTSIVYVVALNEYDQVLLEENGQNRMLEALLLFESIVNSRWFTRTSMILFLNKIDLFKQKLIRSPLNLYFPDYAGQNDDVNRAAKYILFRFYSVNKAGLNLYPQYVRDSSRSLESPLMS